MKPLKTKEAVRVFLKDRLLFLDIRLARFNYMTRLLKHGGSSNIRSKGGLTFPVEIWLMIFDIVENDAESNREYCFVKASVTPSSLRPFKTEKMVCCVRHEFDRAVSSIVLPWPLSKYFENQAPC